MDFEDFVQQLAINGANAASTTEKRRDMDKDRCFFILNKLSAAEFETLDMQDLVALMCFIDQGAIKELSAVQTFLFRSIKSVKKDVHNINHLRSYVSKQLLTAKKMTEIPDEYFEFEGECLRVIGDRIIDNQQVQESIRAYLDKHDPPEWLVWLKRVTELFSSASHAVLRNPIVRDTLLNIIFKAAGVNQNVRMSMSNDHVTIEELPEEVFKTLRIGGGTTADIVLHKK